MTIRNLSFAVLAVALLIVAVYLVRAKYTATIIAKDTATIMAKEPYDFQNDPIGKAFYKKIPALTDVILRRHRARREYSTSDFPMPPDRFHTFRSKIIDALLSSMDGPEGPGSRWVVKNNTAKVSHILDRIEKTFVDTVTVKGTRLELYTIKIKDTEDVVPIALCVPTQTPAPGIILYSGHTAEGGLRDLFVDDDSYQKAMARRLCEAGFVTLAVEKIDSGLMTMHFQRRGERFTVEREPGGGADDELETATTLLGVGDYLIPGRQLMANIAALEILSADPRVDHTKIGAAGVSAGGWMALHSALVNTRIKAIANYGGMWSYLEATMENPDYTDFQGISDFTQLIPGIWKLGDQNRFVLAVPPLVMQIGYGELDHPYTTYKKYFFPVVEQQYQMLGARGNLEIVVHKKGHEFPPTPIIAFFKRRLNE